MRFLFPLSAMALLIAGTALAQTTDPPTDPEIPDAVERQLSEPAAGGQPAPPPATADFLASQDAGQIRAGNIIGKSVIDRDGEEIGKVADVLMDQDGRIVGLVINTGGFLGIGARPVGIPWQNAGDAAGAEQIRVDYSGEELSQAPQFKTLEDLQEEQLRGQQQQELQMQRQSQQGQPSQQ